MSIVEKLCLSFVTFFNFNAREIYRKDSRKYLTRYYIFRKPRKWLPSIYLHCFHAGDEDLELHNHGWRRSISFILHGSYLEERLVNNKIVTRVLKAGNVNYIKANDFHRVDLVSSRVWTLFISGAKVQDWGFIDRDTLEYVPWKLHTVAK